MTTGKKLSFCIVGAALLAIALPLAFMPHAWPAILTMGAGLGMVGATINEVKRPSDVLLFEEGEEVNFVRDGITIISGTLACAIGQVLGQITIGGATETHAGNTGNGAMTIDATTPILAGAQVGVYTVKCTAAASNSGTFRVFDPGGRVLGDVAVAATFADQIKFVIADGATDFIVGDTFLVTVAAGSGKWTQVTPAAVDGSAVAAGVLLSDAFTATLGADATAVAVTRGPAILKTGGLVWTSGMSAGQKTAALAQLASLRILARTDYGV
jgi:hypothetical protein